MAQKDDDKGTYGGAGARFSLNVSAVRVLGLEIGRFGDEHDQAVTKTFVDDLAKIIPGLPQADDTNVKVSVRFEAQIEDSTGHQGDKPSLAHETPENRSTLDINDPEKVALLVKAAKAFSRRPPVQGALLRNGALITLVSFFEGLVSDILHTFYRAHPEALPAESRSLSLSDLRALGSIEDAEQFLTSKEIDSLLRESLDDQLNLFSKRLEVDLSPLGGFRAELAEVFQRRNLLVHNSGIVNRYYLERVMPDLRERYQAEEGKRLFATEEYLKTAINIVQVSGLVLLQQCWRKWEKTNRVEVDAFLIDQLYDSLATQNFDLTARMSEYALRAPFSSDESRRIAVINVAIALKALQRPEEVKRVLQGLDWTACSLKFQVALATLHDQHDRLLELLPRAIAGGEMTKANLSEWPLFASHREDDRFKTVVEKLFPEISSVGPPTAGTG